MRCVFVGQGPNQTAWRRGIKKGDEHARRFCARLAVTGAVGRKLAYLGGFKFSIRFNDYARRNLNARWNGKNGRGDKFDRREGKESAQRLLSEPFTHYVLLGAEVARCFGLVGEPLDERVDKLSGKRFLLFPHPSGINSWWNQKFNLFRARKRLREFLEIEDDDRDDAPSRTRRPEPEVSIRS